MGLVLKNVLAVWNRTQRVGKQTKRWNHLHRGAGKRCVFLVCLLVAHCVLTRPNKETLF